YYPPFDDNFGGLYSVLVDLPAGCGMTDPVELFKPQSAVPIFPAQIDYCPPAPGVIQAINASQFSQVASYEWEGGSTAPFRAFTEAGIYRVTVTIFCEETIHEIEVNELFNPNYELVIDPPEFCVGETVKLYFVGGEDMFLEGGWTSGGSGLLRGDTLQYVPTSTDLVNFYVDAEFAPCEYLGFQIFELQANSISLAPIEDVVLSCTVSEVEVNANVITSFSEVQYRWLGPDGSFISSDSMITVTEVGPHYLEVSSMSGTCLQEAVFTANFDPNAGPAIESELLLSIDSCTGNSVASLDIINDLAVDRIDWLLVGTEDTVLSNRSIAVDLAPGSYIARASLSPSCFTDQTFSIPSLPVLNLSATWEADCPAVDSPEVGLATVYVTATGGRPPYLYMLNDLVSSDSVFSQLPPGDYLPIVIDANGCEAVAEIFNLPNQDLISIDAGENQSISLGSTTSLQLTTNDPDNENATIGWSPATGLSCANCANPVAQPVSSTLYRVSYVNSSGCVSIDSVRVSVIPTANVYIPNAFSPNFDGINDVFQPFPDQSVATIANFQVFDRWGSQVYSYTPSEDLGWDGNINSQPASAGAYVYTLKVTLLNGQERSFEGVVMLLP
ncbi:MAG: gliding motility-associated C-terminal domain-containing protein, partial [Bacteroidota bacterium]